MTKLWQRLSPEQVDLIWSQWKAGWRFGAIGELVQHHPMAVHDHIVRGLVDGLGIRGIARALGRAPSSISREIRRHGGRRQYRATKADARAWRWGSRPKPCRLAVDDRLRRVVEARLEADWSPQQIAHWLVMAYPDDPTMRVSHETIYRTLYVQARGALKRELVQHLRRRHRVRRTRGRASLAQRATLPDPISIAARPTSVEARAVPGHWEGDLLSGSKGSQIATLVERQSRFVLLVRLSGRDAITVSQALIRCVCRLPNGLMKSLTWDRGMEMARHQQFTIATDVQVFFCDPHSPWQRGSNENTNGLLRQYFPKGTDLTDVPQRQLDAVALKLNTRPRETLGWLTPAAVLTSTVAPTG